MSIEERISAEVKASGITIAAISRKTGIEKGRLYPSLAGHRELRADEFLLLCQLLKLDPWDVAGGMTESAQA